MFLQTQTLFLYTETPLHAGMGSGLGNVDLPIQRERPTGYPLVQASGIKGALRSAAQGETEKILTVFGPETSNVTHAGALSTGDARLLLFPVRSLTGVFAWVTNLHVLSRFARDIRHAGLTPPALPNDEPAPNEAFLSGGGVVPRGEKQPVVLEEFSFAKAQNEEANTQTAELAKWLSEQAFPQDDSYRYWRDKIQTSLVILPEDAFRDFVLHATEIATRIRLDPDSKTVATGALWTEEHLPADCLLYVPIRATRLRISKVDGLSESLSEWLEKESVEQAASILEWTADAQNIPHWIQLGGDETVGRGIVQLRWNGGSNG